MSWETYADTMKGYGAYSCGIFERKTGAICCQHKLTLKPSDFSLIDNCCTGRDTKLEIGGEPCVMTNFDKGDWVEGKTRNGCAEDGSKIFYHIEYTNQFGVVVGMIGAGERNASGVCNKIAAHLKSTGM